MAKPTVDKNRILKLAKNEELSTSEIAKVVGCSVCTVQATFRDNGIVRKTKRKREQCMKCKYNACFNRIQGDKAYYCNYISMVGHSRGCKGGNDCTKFEPLQSKGRRVKINES